jgi:hypothetical protein
MHTSSSCCHGQQHHRTAVCVTTHMQPAHVATGARVTTPTNLNWNDTANAERQPQLERHRKSRSTRPPHGRVPISAHTSSRCCHGRHDHHTVVCQSVHTRSAAAATITRLCANQCTHEQPLLPSHGCVSISAHASSHCCHGRQDHHTEAAIAAMSSTRTPHGCVLRNELHIDRTVLIVDKRPSGLTSTQLYISNWHGNTTWFRQPIRGYPDTMLGCIRCTCSSMVQVPTTRWYR